MSRALAPLRALTRLPGARCATVFVLACLCAGCARSPGPSEAPPLRPALLAADLRQQEGDAEAALAGYREAIEVDREAVRPHLRYVAALVRLGRRTEARREYEERASSPQAGDAERTMAERLSTNGASSALRRVYTAAGDRNPESPWWPLALVEVEAAEADAWNRRRLDAIERGDRAKERQAFAQAVGAARRAQRALARASEIKADLPEVHLYRGYLRAVEGDLQASAPAQRAAYGAAAQAFQRAAALDPTMVEAWGGLADARFRTGDVRGSLRAYLEAVRRRPADAELRVGLGVVLHEVGRLREAAGQYQEAARLVPWDADPLIRLGDVWADARNWPKALDAYEAALARDPDAVEAHYKRGTLLEHLGRRGEARAAYERYVDQGGERSGTVQRRIERLLRSEEGGR